MASLCASFLLQGLVPQVGGGPVGSHPESLTPQALALTSTLALGSSCLDGECLSTCSTEQDLRPGFLFAAWQGPGASSLTSEEGLVVSDTSSQESRAEVSVPAGSPAS